MAEAVNGQGDWGAGIYRGREAPPNAAYDLLNLLIDDEGQVFRRGGTAYKSNLDLSIDQLLGLADMATVVGPRTLAWGNSGIYALAADDATPLLVEGVGVPYTARAVGVGGYIAIPSPSGPGAYLYAGSRLTSFYTTGSISLTAGSKTVIGTGTAWLGNIDPGTIITPIVSGGLDSGVVQSIDSNTQVTLTKPAPVTGTIGSYLARARTTAFLNYQPTWKPHAIASAAGRLLILVDNRVYFSEIGDPKALSVGSAEPTSYHELPSEALMLGGEGIGNSALIFTSAGVWRIDNLEFDPLDDLGNIQHTVQQVNKALILWGDGGVASWGGMVLVPAVDDVFLMSPDGSAEAISEAIRPLYRSYVQAGYQPGVAVVHRGHYFLPIMTVPLETGEEGTGQAIVVDMLVCRLDRGYAWTRWSHSARGPALTQRIGSSSRSPRLLGVYGRRIMDLTGCLNPSLDNAVDADLQPHEISIVTRDYLTPSGGRGSTTLSLRAAYEADAAGPITVTAEYARGLEGSFYSDMPLVKGGGLSDGTDHSVWRVNKQGRSIRFRLQCQDALATFTLRSLEAPWRQHGLR